MTSTAPPSNAPLQHTLSNGCRLLMQPDRSNSIVAAKAFLPFSSHIESAREAGLVNFLHGMLMRGTRARTNAELHEFIESLGTSISTDAGNDHSTAQVVCTSDTWRDSLAVFSEVLLTPCFEPEEIEKERISTLSEIRRSDDDKLTFAKKAFFRSFYGEHAYGLPSLGTPETVAEFTRDALQMLHSEFFQPKDFLIAAVGDFDAEEWIAEMERLFGRTTRDDASGAGTLPAPDKAPAATPPFHKRIAQQSEQATLMVGFRACPARHEDQFAMRVLNGVMGESMSSRLFLRLRDERGLAYATGSGYTPMKHAGHIVGFIGTQPSRLDEARDQMLHEFALLRTETVPEDELDRAKKYIVGRFLIDHQRNVTRANYLGHFEFAGYGWQMDNELPARIAAVTSADVQAVAQKYLLNPSILEVTPN